MAEAGLEQTRSLVAELAFSEVAEPWWDDRPTAIVGSGRSLTGFDFSLLRDPRWRVVAVKEAHNELPWADEIVCVDLPWLTRRRETLVGLSAKLVLGMPEDNYLQTHGIPGARHLRRRRVMDGLSDDLSAIEFGGTSGFGALNYVYLKKCRRIGLFGFDYADGHYNPNHYPWYKGYNARYWPRWAREFTKALPQLNRAGVEVFCASPRSNIEAFVRCTPEEGVGRLLQWATETR